MLTIAYMTSRKNPRIEWFFDSLHTQCANDYSAFNVLVIDFWAEEEGRKEEFTSKFRGPKEKLKHVTPKPTVWQGKHRLTSNDYFAAANARNTAICLAPDGHICFVDDLSVLMPGWFGAVTEATSHNRITLGTYKKVKEMVVEPVTGVVTHFKEHPPGNDHRIALVKGQNPHPCAHTWHFGCSLIAPVEAYLSINGWSEDVCDGCGYEDVVTAIALKNQKWQFVIDTRMMTWESEEAHFEGVPMRRDDPCKGNPNAAVRDDMSHAMIRNYSNANRFENSFGPEGIRGERAKALAGEPFPIRKHPDRRWFDGKLLSEL